MQELVDAAPGDVECPTCSQPLTVDLSPDGTSDGQDEAEDTGGAGGGRKGVSKAKGTRGRGRGRAKRGGSTGRGGTAKGRLAGMVAALEASVKKAKPGGASPRRKDVGVKRSVTKKSVINRIDLNKFQSVSDFSALPGTRGCTPFAGVVVSVWSYICIEMHMT